MLAMTRDLLQVRDNYNVYYRRMRSDIPSQESNRGPATFTQARLGLVAVPQIRHSRSTLCQMVRALEDSKVLTPSSAGYTDYMVGNVRQEGVM